MPTLLHRHTYTCMCVCIYIYSSCTICYTTTDDNLRASGAFPPPDSGVKRPQALAPRSGSMTWFM